jgi:hypothetical protein
MLRINQITDAKKGAEAPLIAELTINNYLKIKRLAFRASTAGFNF